jgi:hypothetical protein
MCVDTPHWNPYYYSFLFQIMVPVYSAYLAYTTFTGVRNGMAGMAGPGTAEEGITSQSKRQSKLEKRGGQRMQYR